jgi:DNA-binding transcriptional LysR family regulator
MDLVDFEHDPIDAAIRLGSGHWPSLEAWPLYGCEVRLLVSPDLLKRRPIKDLTDLKRHTLIHPRPSHLDWDSVASFFPASLALSARVTWCSIRVSRLCGRQNRAWW